MTMQLRKLITARHGNYDSNLNLNQRGVNDITRLAEGLRPHLMGNVKLLSSTAPRAIQSAEVLGKIIGVKPEGHEVLWSDGSHPTDLPGVLKLVRESAELCDTLILMTHLEHGEAFPWYFGREELGVNIQSQEIQKGEAWVLDIETRQLTHVK